MGSSSISLDFTKRTRIDRLSKVLITHIKINFTIKILLRSIVGAYTPMTFIEIPLGL